MCNDSKDNSTTGSSFIFGLFLGAIIGAVIAIYIYKNNKSEVLVDLKNKLEKYFHKFTAPPATSTPKPAKKIHKISVSIPKTVESISLTPAKKQSPRKMFVKK